MLDPNEPLDAAQTALLADGVRDAVALIRASLVQDFAATKAIINAQGNEDGERDGKTYAALLLGVISVASSALMTVAANLEVNPLDVLDAFREGYEQMIQQHQSGAVSTPTINLDLPEGADGVEEWLRRNFTPDPEPEAPSE
jgi:hypothetical protein